MKANRTPAGNNILPNPSGFAICEVYCSTASFTNKLIDFKGIWVVKVSEVLRMKICAAKPAHHLLANRYWSSCND
jgi:hypothetical protein